MLPDLGEEPIPDRFRQVLGPARVGVELARPAGRIATTPVGHPTPMMTVITHVTLRRGSEPEWDAAMRDRLDSAREREGWIGNQLLIPLEAAHERTVVGTWSTRADWEAWHNDEAFLETRERMEGLQEGPSDTTWFEVVSQDAVPSSGAAGRG